MDNMDNLKSFGSAFVSGVIHITIGHPFDTIKTLHQSNSLKIRYSQLYRGLLYPVLQNSLINAVTFSSNHHLKKAHDPYISYLYCGGISTLICTPLEHYKILRQYKMKYTHSIYAFYKTYNNIGIVAFRELPATFLYFASYDICKYYGISTFVSGSIAGFTSNVFTYPIDTIKTRLQSGECNTIYAAYQKRGLMKGVGVCGLRSLIVNGINFSVYEYLMKLHTEY